MGCYVNPKGESKEFFLDREALEVPKADWSQVPKDSIPVVLVNNGMFTAAGIAFSEKEYNVFICGSVKPQRL